MSLAGRSWPSNCPRHPCCPGQPPTDRGQRHKLSGPAGHPAHDSTYVLQNRWACLSSKLVAITLPLSLTYIFIFRSIVQWWPPAAPLTPMHHPLSSSSCQPAAWSASGAGFLASLSYNYWSTVAKSSPDACTCKSPQIMNHGCIHNIHSST